MRRKLRVNEEILYEALPIVGYHQTKEYRSSSEWRRLFYHLTIRERGGKRLTKLDLQLHRDINIQMPPFHKAVLNAPDVAAEMEKILDAYKKRRALKSG